MFHIDHISLLSHQISIQTSHFVPLYLKISALQDKMALKGPPGKYLSQNTIKAIYNYKLFKRESKVTLLNLLRDNVVIDIPICLSERKVFFAR